MTEEKKIKCLQKDVLILSKALLKACKMLREYPPTLEQTIIPYNLYLKILVGGIHRDPDGKEFASYFIDEVTREKEEESN